MQAITKMKKLISFILFFWGMSAIAQTPNVILQYGVLDNTSYLSVATAATTYAPITVSQIYTSGTTVTVNNTTTWLIVNPSATVAALTITMPATPYDAQIVEISFGKAIAGGLPVITLLTVSPNTGQTLLQPLTLDQLLSGENLKYQYSLSLTNWYKK